MGFDLLSRRKGKKPLKETLKNYQPSLCPRCGDHAAIYVKSTFNGELLCRPCLEAEKIGPWPE